jgi:hypothetical protein
MLTLSRSLSFWIHSILIQMFLDFGIHYMAWNIPTTIQSTYSHTF